MGVNKYPNNYYCPCTNGKLGGDSWVAPQVTVTNPSWMKRYHQLSGMVCCQIATLNPQITVVTLLTVWFFNQVCTGIEVMNWLIIIYNDELSIAGGLVTWLSKRLMMILPIRYPPMPSYFRLSIISLTPQILWHPPRRRNLLQPSCNHHRLYPIPHCTIGLVPCQRPPIWPTDHVVIFFLS